jgi:phosphatidylethanolamine/phosphatidyl-N-methylethanolamine N-methyltransferase
MSLRFSYTLLAPFYDFIAGPAFARARAAGLQLLPHDNPCEILLNGIGTGLDLPHVPACHHYTGLDITRAMLRRAQRRGSGLEVQWVQGDSLALPFRDACFDHAVLHLILAVAGDPVRVLLETARTLKNGGGVFIFDKFLRPGERAPLRRLISPLAAGIATRTDIVFEKVLEKVPGLQLVSDEPALANGWFRSIRLVKRAL